nr:PREDICTED: metabotropic glutamate receptor-like isoform X3 [Megachile rotundata]
MRSKCRESATPSRRSRPIRRLATMIRTYLASLLAFGLSARRPSVGEERGLWYANVTGDFLLGGLFPVHRKGIGGQSCGEIQIEDGVQPLEAMLYTVGRVNDDPRILPGVKLGVLAFDTCDNPGYALEGAFHFVKGKRENFDGTIRGRSKVFLAGFVARSKEFGQGEAGYRCEDRSAPKYLDGEFDRVIAILGAQSSSVTIQIASVLALFPVPQISYMATSPFLSSKERFPHFFRTVPNDVNQARAMLEILRRFEWSYVSVVYSDSEYGDHGYETLVSLADEYSICFSAPHRVVQDRFTTEDYDNVVRTIAEKTEVRVVVLFAEKSTTLLVLEAARRVGVGSRFVWLGSDSWPDVRPSSETREIAELEGALAVQPLYASLSGFDEYFTGLKLDHERTNPWFREFWQKYHDCADERVSWKRVSRDPRVRCDDPRLKIQRSNGYKQHRSLHFVRDAVYAAAYALHELHRDVCGEGYRGVCEEMLPLNERAFSRYLAKVSFKGIAFTSFVCSVFWKYRDTPMIKASGRELSFLLLLGTFGCFSMTFAVVAKPSVHSCAVVRFGIGFCYTICYAALATKINRIHRIFNDPARSPRKRRYTSPRSQLAIASILSMIEVAFDASWLLKEPPAVTHSYPSRDANVRVCKGSEDGSYVIGLLYPFVLTVASTVYAIKTRKCPEGFNETRRIAFANYATIILWLAFVPLYLASSSNEVKVITLALSLSLNGLVQLLCLFLPKVYVVLIRPEKNTRELVMARPAGSSHPTGPATPIPP